MSSPEIAGSVAWAVLSEIGAAAALDPRVVVGVLAEDSAPWAAHLEKVPSGQRLDFQGTPALAFGTASERVGQGDLPVLVGPAGRVGGEGYASARDTVGRRHANVKVVGLNAGLPSDGSLEETIVLDDVGLFRAIPGVSVFAPADASSATAAIRAALRHDGPVYVRVPPGRWPEVTNGSFVPGKATVLQEGSDLTIAAYGPLVGQALHVAERLRAVGLAVRVLDCASVKPLDEKAVVRAARETGALLTLEDHTPLTGLGAAVALLAGPEVPVPIRALGIPDLYPASRPGERPWEAVGLGLDAIVDEAWELLRLRGKVQ